MPTAEPEASNGAKDPVAGWQEWIALPALDLVAIKAKIDTGARTSALHADDIDISGSGASARVRFKVHPSPRRPDLVIACMAPLIEVRGVTSSNGTRENRPVIRTRLVMGERQGLVDITLTNRGGMTYRMLLGRQALTALGVVVDARLSFQMPKLGFRLYPGASSGKARKA